MASTLVSSASVTSLCKGCTAAAAAAPPPPSLPPAGKVWRGSLLLTHPGPPWMALAGALVPLAVSLLLTSCLLLAKLLPRAAATAGAWIPPGWGQKTCCRRLSLLTCHCTPAPPACSRRCSPGAPPRPPPASPSWPRPPCGRR